MKKRGFVAILLTLVMALSPVAGVYADDISDSAVDQLISSAAAATNATVWRFYGDANAQKDSAQYDAAISNYAAAVKFFLAGKSDPSNLDNAINGYRNIAECYAALGDYNMAASAWHRAADYCAEYYATWGGDSKLQEEIAYNRKASIVEADVDIYLKSNDPAFGDSRVYGAAGEPANGTILGAYAAEDPVVSDPILGLYWDKFPQTVGKKHGVYLLYFNYGSELSLLDVHIEQARSHGYAIELGLQPMGGVGMVNSSDGYLARLAQAMQNSGVQFYLRFANEMNLSSTVWYTTPEAYISAFRTVADVFHSYAPSVPVVWSPNDFPPTNIEDYYPGDAYVDYVGISQYMTYLPEIDPLGQGQERRRWIDQMDTIYKLYADRKPIILSEGGSPNKTPAGASLSQFTAEQITDFYAYLPMRYPNVKMVVWFDWTNKQAENGIYDYRLTTDSAILNAYRQAIQSDSFLSSPGGSSNTYYKKLENGSTLPISGQASLCAYVGGINRATSVTYSINGATLGTAASLPYECAVDLSAYAGQLVNITAQVAYANGTSASKTFAFGVGTDASQAAVSQQPEQPATEQPAASGSGISVTVDGVAVNWTDAVPFIDENNRTLVPLRAVADAMGLEVSWDADAREARFTSGSKILSFPVGSNTASLVDGLATQYVEMDTAARIVDGRTFAPARYLAESFGYDVGWDGPSRTVVISSK